MTLILRNIIKNFGKICAVDNISFKVEDGEFLTLLGPSGCGKTTILRIIAGLENLTSGQVFLDGTDISHKSPTKRDVSIMFQDYALFPHMSITENVAYGLRMRGVSKVERNKLSNKWLETMQLSGFGNRLPSELSGGQKQRAALARALITSPKILLLDEPLSALDANLRIRLREELRKIHSKVGTTFICVTHDQDEAMALSDRIAILKEGKIEQMGSPNKLYDEPKTEFVAEFFGKCALWPLNKKDGNTLLAGTNMECKVRNPSNLDKCKAVIRPEYLKIFSNGKKTQNSINAKVLDVLSKGSNNQVTVEFENGLILDLQIPRSQKLPPLSTYVQIKMLTTNLHSITSQLN